MQQSNVLRPPPGILNPAVTRLFALVAVLAGLLLGAAAGFGASPNLLIMGALSPFLLMFIYARPHWTVAVYVVLVYADLLSILVKYHDFPPLARFAGAIMLGAVLGYRLVYRGERLRRDQVTPWFVAYGGVVALGLVYARNTDLVMTNVIELIRNFLTYLIVINAITTMKRLNVMLWLLLAMGAFLALLSLYQSVTGNTDNDFGGLAQYRVSDITLDTEGARPGGTIGDANYYGQSLLILVPIGLYFAFGAQRLLPKLAGLLCALVLMGGVVFTYSRGDAVALGALVLAGLVYKRPRLPVLLGLAVAAVLALQLLPANYVARLSTITDLITGSRPTTLFADDSLRGRAGAVQAAVEMFADHPVLGVGRENYPLYQLQYLKGTAIALTAKAIPPHDLYLEVAAEHGIVGLVVFGGLLVATFAAIRDARRRFLAQANPRSAELAVWLGIGLFSYLVSGLFLHGAFIYMLLLQITIIVALRQIARTQELEPVVELPPPSEAVAPILPFEDIGATKVYIMPASKHTEKRNPLGLPALLRRNAEIPDESSPGAQSSSYIYASPQPQSLSGSRQLDSTTPASSQENDALNGSGVALAELFQGLWEANGGEAVFGWPVSPVFEEMAGEVAVPVQYFEYARLEYRPWEADSTAGIVLGKLGLEVQVEGMAAGGPLPEALVREPVEGRGQGLGGPHIPRVFHEVWQAVGGEAVCGWPISPVLTVTPTDGWPLYVQYFERSRFEYHPEHADTSYAVQRTPVGRLVYMSKYISDHAAIGDSH